MVFSGIAFFRFGAFDYLDEEVKSERFIIPIYDLRPNVTRVDLEYEAEYTLILQHSIKFWKVDCQACADLEVLRAHGRVLREGRLINPHIQALDA